MQVSEQEGRFVTAFAKYLKSRVAVPDQAAGEGEPQDKQLQAASRDRGAMLGAFSAFLTADSVGVGLENARYYELLAKMTAFATPVPPSDPGR